MGGISMRKLALSAVAIVGAALASTAAVAGPVVYIDCGQTECFDDTVLVNIDTGYTGHKLAVQFAFSSTTDNLDAVGPGDSKIISPPPDELINNFTISIQPGYGFTMASINLRNQFSNDTKITLTTAGGTSTPFPLDFDGANRFGVDASNFGLLTSLTIDSALGFGVIRQLGIGGITSLATTVPEPASWAMVLVGFGAIGIGMRGARRPAGIPQTSV